MKKFLLKIMLFILICTLLLVPILTPINFIFENNDGRYTYRMMNEMYDSVENIDVLFLGSSHVYRAYDAKLADDILGLKAFNAGSSSQGMNTSYYLLREIYKYNDLKTVYLDTFFGMANTSVYHNKLYLISDYMKTGINKTNLLLSNGGPGQLLSGYATVKRNTDNLNIVKNIKSHISEISDYSSVTYDNEEYRGDGFVYSYEVADAKDESVYDINYEWDLNADVPVSDLYYKSLMNIIKFCSENDIELVLVNQPMPKKTLDSIDGYDNFVQYMKQIAEDNNLMYWNFDLYKGDLGLTMEYYKDGNHLNGKGADIYTEFFCNFVKEIKENGYDEEKYFYPSYQ